MPRTPVIDRENCTYFRRATCKACEKFCEKDAIRFDQQDEELTVDVGNIILATGYDIFDARKIAQYGYGRLPNVFTSLEFERLTNSAGPTNGHVVLRDGVTEPKTVGVIHCVGSRDRNFNNYCSAICCMQSLKFAHLVKEHTGATVYNFYIDMRTAAKGYDEFYQRVMEEGTLFVRGKPAEVTEAGRLPGEEGKLIVQVEDTLAGRQRRIPVDMVVLSVGLRASRRTPRRLAQRFGISCSSDGWAIEKHPKLDPVATMTEGVFIAGCVSGPKDIPDIGVAGRGGGRSSPGHDPAEADEPRADQGHGPRRALLRLPHLQHACARTTPSASTTPRASRASTRPCARAAEPASRPARPEPSPARASATSRSWPRSKACSESGPTGRRPSGRPTRWRPTTATATAQRSRRRCEHEHADTCRTGSRGEGDGSGRHRSSR